MRLYTLLCLKKKSKTTLGIQKLFVDYKSVSPDDLFYEKRSNVIRSARKRLKHRKTNTKKIIILVY